MLSCVFFQRLLLLALASTLVWASVARGQLATPSKLPQGDARTAGFDPEKLAAVDAILERSVKERQIAGGAALIARRGKIVKHSIVGLQDAEAGVPMSEATIFRIASMTKPITSVAIMTLVEEGKLALDDPVAKFIPEFENIRVLRKDAQPNQPLAEITAPVRAPPTIRHLLNHTSGITYGLWDRPILGKLHREAGVSDGLAETPGTMGDNCRRLAGVPLLFEPGTAWEYGLNTDVLGRVIEVASGQSLDAFFRERIFEPLAMRDTHFHLPAEKRLRLAALYAPDDAKHFRRVGDGPQHIGALTYSATYPLDEQGKYFSGGAGLVSTLNDYARFLQALLNGGELDGRRLLKPETVALMTRNQIGDLSPAFDAHGDKFGYGFGVVTAEGKSNNKEVASVGSYSWGGIFYTYFLVDPRQDLIILIATQIYPFDHLTLHADVKRAVYDALLPN